MLKILLLFSLCLRLTDDPGTHVCSERRKWSDAVQNVARMHARSKRQGSSLSTRPGRLHLSDLVRVAPPWSGEFETPMLYAQHVVSQLCPAHLAEAIGM